jgi:hypothetical protein
MTLLPRRLEPHGFPEFAMGQNREPTTVLLCEHDCHSLSMPRHQPNS